MIASIHELLVDKIKQGHSVQKATELMREELDGQPEQFWDEMAFGTGVARAKVREKTYGALATIANLVTQMEQARMSQN